jgi:crotonobetainyl-CoA:carnitine CoA-transferase CaiB-like acyl-CoA transferase
VFAIGAALRYRNRTGKGQWVDIGMYQAGVMFLSEYIMDASVNGRDGGRIGNRHPHRAPQGCYPASGEDQWITLSVSSDDEWQSLCRLMERDELARDPRFADVVSRRNNHDEIDRLVGDWTRDHDKYDLMHRLQAEGIASGPVLNGKEVHFDPHYRSRNFLERVTYPEERNMGSRFLMGRPYKLTNTPLEIRGPAPTFGAHNGPVLQELLALDEDTYQELVQDAVIATVPMIGNASPALDPRQAVEQGLLGGWEPDYREQLGLS